jgi:hypothetical protein
LCPYAPCCAARARSHLGACLSDLVRKFAHVFSVRTQWPSAESRREFGLCADDCVSSNSTPLVGRADSSTLTREATAVLAIVPAARGGGRRARASTASTRDWSCTRSTSTTLGRPRQSFVTACVTGPPRAPSAQVLAAPRFGPPLFYSKSVVRHSAGRRSGPRITTASPLGRALAKVVASRASRSASLRGALFGEVNPLLPESALMQDEPDLECHAVSRDSFRQATLDPARASAVQLTPRCLWGAKISVLPANRRFLAAGIEFLHPKGRTARYIAWPGVPGAAAASN